MYWRNVEKIMKVVDDIRVRDGIVPLFLAPDSVSSRLPRFVLEVGVIRIMVMISHLRGFL
jgi:hypothetical protein